MRKATSPDPDTIDVPAPIADTTDLTAAPRRAPLPAKSINMFERLARDPNVDVVKLQALIDMQKQVLAQEAEREFNEAYALMQAELPSIDKNGAIIVKGDVRGRYATLDAIHAVIKPILGKYGFALRFTNAKEGGWLTCTGTLSHRAGHSIHDDFSAQADNTGSKNDIQAIGSFRTYAMRYITKALLNISEAETDDDAVAAGRLAEQKKAPGGERTMPEGYQEWLMDLQATADEGLAALQAAWNPPAPNPADAEAVKARKHHEACKHFLHDTDAQRWERIKVRAMEADKRRKKA